MADFDLNDNFNDESDDEFDEFDDYDYEPVTLEFEDGETLECIPLFVFDVDGIDYVALTPNDDDSEDVYFYEYYEINDEEFDLIDIEDDKTFDKVAAEFERILSEDEE